MGREKHLMYFQPNPVLPYMCAYWDMVAAMPDLRHDSVLGWIENISTLSV